MGQMAVVGLTEKYHESLMLLKYIGGLTITRYRSVNKGVKRPKLADVPPDIPFISLLFRFYFGVISVLFRLFRYFVFICIVFS
jgi:hypothetical protein